MRMKSASHSVWAVRFSLADCEATQRQQQPTKAKVFCLTSNALLLRATKHGNAFHFSFAACCCCCCCFSSSSLSLLGLARRCFHVKTASRFCCMIKCNKLCFTVPFTFRAAVQRHRPGSRTELQLRM